MSYIRRFLVLLPFIVLSTLIVHSSSFIFEHFDVGDVADKDIIAPKAISYEDKVATRTAREEALSAVKNVYNPDESIQKKLNSDLNSFLTDMIRVKTAVNKQVESNKTNDNFVYDDFVSAQLKKAENPFEYSKDDLMIFFKTDEKELQKLNSIFSKKFQQVFTAGIMEEQLDATRKQFEDDATLYFFSKDVVDKLLEKLTPRIIPNMVLDENATNKKKKEALDKIEVVYKTVVKNEVVIRYGEKVTAEHMEKLEKLGLVQGKVDVKRILTTVPFVTLLFVMFHVYCFRFYGSIFKQKKVYIFLLSLITFSLLLTNFMNDSRLFVFPFSLSLFIIVSLWGSRFVMFISIIQGFLFSLNNGNDYVSLFMLISSGIMISLLFKKGGKKRSSIHNGLLLGVTLSVIHFVTSLSFDLKSNTDYYVQSCGFIILSVVVAAIIANGSLSFIEDLLDVVSDSRLHALNDLSHPLLRRLQHEAPGTFSHSNMVGNLAELAADEIGANGLFLRVGAYFHDVGKLKYPLCYIENSSPSENVHNTMDPLESAKIILNHPHESVRLCKEYRLPTPLLKLIECHHSDSVLEHFYKNACDKDPDIDRELFRYQTPTPKTKEEGILLMADSTEAFSRVLKGKPKEEASKLLHDMLYKKIKQGDFRDCALSMGEFQRIINVFEKYLLADNHQRTEYRK